MKPRSILALLLALAAVVPAGCGMPTDGSPRALPPDDVPFGLLEPDPVSTTTTAAPSGASSLVTIYLVGPQPCRTSSSSLPCLVAVERRVSAPATVEKVLDALVLGPNDAETDRGLRTAISPATEVLSAPVEAGIATIDLASGFTVGELSEQIVGFAQFVYSATSLSGVAGVRFTLNGAPAQFPQGDGTTTQTPVGRAAYASLAPL